MFKLFVDSVVMKSSYLLFYVYFFRPISDKFLFRHDYARGTWTNTPASRLNSPSPALAVMHNCCLPLYHQEQTPIFLLTYSLTYLHIG